MKTIWGRLGVSFSITDEEEKAIFGGNEVLARETMKRIISEKRFVPDGDSYIPEESVELFNEQYDTGYEANEVGFEI